MATGLFSNRSANQGLNFRARRRAPRGERTIDQFAERLSEHTDAADIAAGRGLRLDPGGDVRVAARFAGCDAASGNGMLQRLRRDLGPQAR